MPRRPKAEAETAQPRRRGAHARLEIQGTPEEVKEHLGENGEPQVDPDGADEFARLLGNPRYRCIVERDDPVEHNGFHCEGEVKKFRLPKTWEDILDFTARHHGGRKYRATITNPKDGDILAARQFEVDGEPILPEGPTDQQVAEKMFADYRTKEEGDPVVSMDKQQILLNKQIEIEQAEQRLETLRERRKGGKPDPQEDNRIRDLERKIEAQKYETRITGLEAKLETFQREREHPRRGGESDVTAILREMRSQQERSDDRFERLIEKMQDRKMDAIQNELRALRETPQKESSSLKESVQTVKDIAEMLGVDLPGSKDDDEGDEKKEWWELVVEKHVPRILSLIENNQKEGKGVTKEQLAAELKKTAQEAEDEAVRNAKTRVLAAASPQPTALPAGGTAAGTPPQPRPQGAAPQQPQVPKTLSVEDERKMRCGMVLEVFDRESQMRPHGFEWNYNAWQTIPADIRDKLCMAADPIAMLGVFEGIAKPEGLQELRNRLGADPQAMAWANRGLVELKRWYDKLQLDPNFDPDQEDEEGDEGGDE